METIRISESKVKIMCTEEDLRAYDLGMPVDIETAKGKRRLRRLLSDACGFDANEGHLFVQIYESVTGGCELFVTLTETMIGGDGMFLPRQLTGAPSPTQSTRQKTPVAYLFPDFDALLAICGRLAGPPRLVERDAAAYSAGGNYYLLTYGGDSRLDVICGEYDGKRCSRGADAYLAEHGQLICRDAVDRLSDLRC